MQGSCHRQSAGSGAPAASLSCLTRADYVTLSLALFLIEQGCLKKTFLRKVYSKLMTAFLREETDLECPSATRTRCYYRGAVSFYIQ